MASQPGSTGESGPPVPKDNNPMRRERLVLVGGGHSHLQVIKGLNHARRPESLDVVLIDQTDAPCYSGMVPSAVAGIYSPEETLVDLRSLSEWAGIRFVNERVTGIDLTRKLVVTTNAANNGEHVEIPFDAISIDIGSTSRGLKSVPGARHHSIPTRPISELVRKVEAATDELRKENGSGSGRTANVVVVGGGAAGIELSMGVLGRWKTVVGATNVRVTILNSVDKLFPDETPANREALLQRLDERGIAIRNNAEVGRVDRNSLLLQSGEQIDFTHCIWATGADCHLELVTSLRRFGLAISENGWIKVNESFQSLSHPFVFAAGDCCTMAMPNGVRSPPKAGVYAVRAGPILIENLTRFLENSKRTNDGDEDTDNTRGIDNDSNLALKKYEPQRDFLKLLACGDGKALGFRFGVPIYGKWVFELKDAIDRSFMDLFKKENLPELTREQQRKKQTYDTSQYDAASKRPPPLPPIEAAFLLQRTDDDVDFQGAWDVLRDMAEDDSYRDSVLENTEATALSRKEQPAL